MTAASAVQAPAMRAENVVVVRLRDRPAALGSVVRWIDEEWGAFSGRTLDETKVRFAQELRAQALPASFVAIDVCDAVGVATLRERDSVDWDPEATPWICNVYVRRESRGQGIAGSLCRALEGAARELGYPVVYLATRLPDASLYDRLGYELYRTTEGLATPMYLMRRRLV